MEELDVRIDDAAKGYRFALMSLVASALNAGATEEEAVAALNDAVVSSLSGLLVRA